MLILPAAGAKRLTGIGATRGFTTTCYRAPSNSSGA